MSHPKIDENCISKAGNYFIQNYSYTENFNENLIKNGTYNISFFNHHNRHKRSPKILVSWKRDASTYCSYTKSRTSKANGRKKSEMDRTSGGIGYNLENF